MPRRVTAAALALLLAVTPLPAAQPQFWEIDEATDFLDGDLAGLSVDAFGRVRLSAATPVLHNPACPYVWTLALDSKGAVYAGTGNDGQVIRWAGGEAAVFFDAPELEVHAIAAGADGKVYVGTSPDGRVYAVDAKGEATDFFDPEERYIWGLAFDEKGDLWVATGDAGKVHRVSRDGKSEVMLEGPESHITALAVDGGRVYAGSSPSGVIYRIEPAEKRTFVLQDTLYREIKALTVGADGSVYAAAVEGGDKEDPSRTATAPTPVAPTTGTVEVSVTESFMGVLPPLGPTPAGTARTVESPRTGQTKGALLKLLPTGEVDLLWSSAEEMPFALYRDRDGVLVGTGAKGKLYRIADSRTWTMVASLPVQQLTAIAPAAGGGLVIATSNPGTLYGFGAGPGEKGTYTSKVRDTETVSSWGRIQWHAETPGASRVQLETRSGNTATPDKTWSEWSAPYSRLQGDPITSERARFLQIRATLEGNKEAGPTLDSVRIAYLQRNLRPQVTSVTVHPPGEVFQKPLSVTGDTEILGLDPASAPERAPTPPPGMPLTTYSRKLYQKGLQTFSWKGEDPNGDALVYDIEYRPVHDTRFRPLRSGLTETVLAWDTSTVPNGRYVVRIVARDTPANPEGLALNGDKESPPFEVDNTPPAVTAAVAGKSRVRATARDDSSLIRRAEYSLDGSRWEEIHPQDGISDSLEEVYEFAPRGLTSGPHVVVVRVTDLLGNVSTARLNID